MISKGQSEHSQSQPFVRSNRMKKWAEGWLEQTKLGANDLTIHMHHILFRYKASALRALTYSLVGPLESGPVTDGWGPRNNYCMAAP